MVQTLLWMLACGPVAIEMTDGVDDETTVETSVETDTTTTTTDTETETTEETGTSTDDTDTSTTTTEPDTGTVTLPDAPAPGDIDDLFGDDVIEIRLTLETEAWNNIYQQSQEARQVGAEFYDFEFVECTVTYNDIEYGPVGVRIKGQGSFQPIWIKSSLKLKFDLYNEDLRFIDGLNRLTLNNMTNDYSMTHERMAYRVYREAGVPASRAGHAQVYINDELYGLYTVLETVDKDMIREWYESDEGVLYEGWDVDFSSRYVDDFEYEFGDDTVGRAVLAQAAAALDANNGQDALDAVDAYIDVDQFLRFWAAEGVIGQFDSYPYSSPGDDYFVYLDPSDNRFDFIPWGNDETFYSPSSNITSVTGTLAQECMRSFDCQERFAEYVWEIQTIAEGFDGSANGWLDYYDMMVDQIQPYVEADEHKVYSDRTVEQYQDSMRSFIEERPDKLRQWVGPRP